MTDITELALSLKAAAESVIKNYDSEWFETGRQICTVHKSKVNLISLANPANIRALVEALENKDADAEWMRKRIAELAKERETKEEQRANWFQMAQKLGEDLDSAEKRNAELVEALEKAQLSIAELEREQEHLRPVGVMSEKASLRVENSKSRFIELWLRPGIFLPHKRPEHSMSYYAGMAVLTGTKAEIY